MLFQQTHNLNNINGTWTVEFGGISGDKEYIRKDFIEQNKDLSVVYSGDKGLTGGVLGDLDDVTYQNPFERDGNVWYEVWAGDSPVMQDVEVTDPVTGQKGIQRSQVYDRIDASAQVAEEQKKAAEEKQKEIERLEDEYRKATLHLQSDNPYNRGRSAKNVRNIPKQIEALQSGNGPEF